MIVVDTSALMAIVLDEPPAKECIDTLALGGDLVISAGTVAEALIVAARRNVGPEMERLLSEFEFEIANVTQGSARRVADVYAQWGKGVHPAGLNSGDCFAYEAAKERGCPLLYVGDDFARTDITSAL
jgi:ribonuclease VapC